MDDVWRLKDFARIIYPQAKEELGYEIISKYYDEEDNCVGVREVVFRFRALQWLLFIFIIYHEWMMNPGMNGGINKIFI